MDGKIDRIQGSVAKTGGKEKRREVFDEDQLSGQSKGHLDEMHLSRKIPSGDSLNLSFPDHVHRLIPLQRSRCRFQRKEAQAGFDQAFDEAMVLLDQIVEVFHLPQFHVFRQDSCGFELSNGFGIGSVLIDVYNTRGCFGDFLCLLLERVSRRLLTCIDSSTNLVGAMQGYDPVWGRGMEAAGEPGSWLVACSASEEQ